jgi:hypothetical protein
VASHDASTSPALPRSTVPKFGSPPVPQQTTFAGRRADVQVVRRAPGPIVPSGKDGQEVAQVEVCLLERAMPGATGGSARARPPATLAPTG